MPQELTFRQRLFVEAYIGAANGNATEAARIAGYRWPNKVAERLVGKSGIQARIRQRVASAAMPANEILARLSDQASADIGEFLDIDESGGWRLNLRKSGRRTHLIKRIKRTRDGADIEIRDSLPALVKLGEYHGLGIGPRLKRSIWRRSATGSEARREAIGRLPAPPRTEASSGEAEGA